MCIRDSIKGGGQEFGKRSGTENLMNIQGFAKSIEERLFEINSGKWDEIKSNRDYLEEMILNESYETLIVGKKVNRLPNTSFFITPGWKNDLQVATLDLEGFSVSSGMACSSGKKIKNNSTNSDLITFAGFYSTFSDILGVPDESDGTSMMDIFSDNIDPDRGEYAEVIPLATVIISASIPK